MKNTLFIILLFLNAVGYSQTLPSLPTGSKPYGNQLYLDANGNIIGGTGSAKFRIIGQKKQVDSLNNILDSKVNSKVDTNEYHVYLIAGQSNALGSSLDSNSAPTVRKGIALQYYLGGLKPVFKNVGAGTGGAWPAFANEIYIKNQKKILFVPTAIGSTSQTAAANTGNGTWDVSGTLRGSAVSQVNAAIAAAKAAGLTPIFKGILWSQGESDAGALFSGTITKATYSTALVNMIDYFRSIFGNTMPFYIFRTGGQPGNTGFIPIRAVQDSVSDAQKYTYMVYRDAVTFFARGLMRVDNLHYTQEGYNQMGVVGADNVFAQDKISQITNQYDQIGIGIREPKSALDIYGDSTISIKGLPKISGGTSGIGFNGAVNTSDQVNTSATKFAGRTPVWDFNSTLTTNGTEYEDLFTIRHRGTPTSAAVKRSVAINMHLSNQNSAGEAAKNGGFELRSLAAFATVPQLYWFVGNKEHGRFGNDGSFSMGLNNNAPFQYFNNYTNDLNYERLGITYASGQFKILADQLGSGLFNELVLGTPNRQLIFNHTGTGTDPYFLRFASGSGANNQRFIGFVSPISSSAGLNPYVNIRPVINQSGSAGYSALSIYPVENTVGTNMKMIIDAGVGTTQRMRLESSGLFNLNGVNGLTFDPSDSSLSLGTNPAIETTSDAALFRNSSGKVTQATVYKKSEITALLADTAASLYRTKLNSVSLSGLQMRLNAYTPITRFISNGFGLNGGGNLGTDRSFSVDTNLIASRANSPTLAQLQTKINTSSANLIKQSGNAFGTTMTVGTTDVNDFNLIRNSVVNFEVTSAGPNFPLGVRSSGAAGAAFSGTSTTGPAAYFNNSSTGSGATLVVNNQSTGLLATFSKSGSTKVTISNEGNVSATGVFSGYGLSLPQRGVSADYTLTDLDYSVMVVGSSSTINIYLPVTPSGRIFIIKRILGGTGPVIISSPGSVIDNVSTKTLSTDNSGVVVQSAGAGQYYVIGTI